MNTKLQYSNFALLIIAAIFLFVDKKFAFEASMFLMLVAIFGFFIVKNRDDFDFRRFF